MTMFNRTLGSMVSGEYGEWNNSNIPHLLFLNPEQEENSLGRFH
jgi:hypothetical protein